MTEVLDSIEQPPLVVRTAPVFEMDDDEFFEFCQLNDSVRIERNAQGEIIFMAPAGGESSRSNVKLVAQFELWSEADGTGTVFDSSGGFILPNKAVRSPDVSWVLKSRIAQLTEEQWKKFLPLCPDFVLELRSPSDSVHALKLKMDEYIVNGSRLGWLIDPIQKKAHLYRPNQPVEILNNPVQLSGEEVLKGFTLNLHRVWSLPRT